MSLASLRASLATAAATVGGLHGYDYPPGDPVTPCAVVEPEEVDFEAKPGSGFRRGGEVWRMSVFVLVASADSENAARKVDAFFDRSANDLKDALEGVDPQHISVASADRWGEYPLSGRVFAGCRFVVEVLS